MPLFMIGAVIICAFAMANAPAPKRRNCVICGHPAVKVVRTRHYCVVCLKFMSKGLHRTVRKAALIAAWNKDADAFLCYYTGVTLELWDVASPFYLTFDHAIPGDNSRFVACARFVNEMKSEMAETEFRANIHLLAEHFKTGKPIDQSLFKVEYFRKKPKAVSTALVIRGLGLPQAGHYPEDCLICGKKPIKYGFYCARCHGIMSNEAHDLDAKIQALKNGYDKDVDGFRCHYTGFLLDLTDPTSPWHACFDHCFPGRPGKYWLACEIINEMKTELSEEEIKKVVIELARHFETGAPYDRDIIKFEYWTRPRL